MIIQTLAAAPKKAAASTKVDLAGGWDSLWSAVLGSGVGPLLELLTWVGVGVLVVAMFAFLWEKRKGSGGNLQKIAWAAAVGLFLAAPGFVIPVVLRLIDILRNGVVKIAQAIG